MNAISNMDDVIDSRDVIERIEELREIRDDWIDEVVENGGEFDMAPEVDWHNAHTDEGCELDALEALAAEGEDYAADWVHGEALVRDSYFEEYAEQLAEDCGLIDSNVTWPNNCIDWTRAAQHLQYDYSAIDFDGVTYWVR
ncbi:MAG: hypothetical protein AAF628_08275 [Planctomycetota bacterium]